MAKNAIDVAIGGKADMGVALQMSANDPKRTSAPTAQRPETRVLKVCYFKSGRRPVLSLGGGNEAARLHQAYRRCGSSLAAWGACAASPPNTLGWLPMARGQRKRGTSLLRGGHRRVQKARLRQWQQYYVGTSLPG